MARRTAARQASRVGERGGGTAAVRAEIGAIALVVFALLTLVALLSDQGAVLHWWRETLLGLLGWGAVAAPLALAALAVAVWYAPLRARIVLPSLGLLLVLGAVLGILHVALGEGLGGIVGASIGGLASTALGPAGGLIVLVALALVGVVVAANRTLVELLRPAVERRPSLPIRTGGTPTLTSARPAPLADDAAQMRINLPASADPEAKPPAAPKASVGQGPAAAEPARASSPIPGLPSAVVAVEGVLHAAADREWTLPSLESLSAGDAGHAGGKAEVERRARTIEETLAHFSIAAKVVEATVGPVVTRYEIKPAPGVKLSRIEALSDDLALALAARTLRIEAPIPGKSVVGIEVPNIAVGLVSLRDVAESAAFKEPSAYLNVAIGRDVAGSPVVLDLAAMPHLLVAGQTGSGKSVSVMAIISSLLLSRTPDEVRLLIGDLKRVDFAGFRDLPHLVVDVMIEVPRILNALYWVTGEMDRRYRLFARASARNIASYNEKRTGADRIPYIVFIIDELADLMLQAPIQVEKQITRVAQLARATGIHLVLGTQRPSVDVITGLIKANIPARIAFATASAVDSRTIIDMTGAEKLLGRGDMLVLRPDLAAPIRAQGVFVSDREINELAHHWTVQAGRADYDRRREIVEGEDRLVRREDGGESDIDDERYEEAVEIVQRAGQASVSMLQRKMTVGFARAGRLIDVMEQNGVIGPAKGPGKFREVYGSASRRRNAEDDEQD